MGVVFLYSTYSTKKRLEILRASQTLFNQTLYRPKKKVKCQRAINKGNLFLENITSTPGCYDQQTMIIHVNQSFEYTSNWKLYNSFSCKSKSISYNRNVLSTSFHTQ